MFSCVEWICLYTYGQWSLAGRNLCDTYITFSHYIENIYRCLASFIELCAPLRRVENGKFIYMERVVSSMWKHLIQTHTFAHILAFKLTKCGPTALKRAPWILGLKEKCTQTLTFMDQKKNIYIYTI